jgi:branched-chain amino acid transport system permease protein
MSANIRPSGVFDTNYKQDLAINRTPMSRLLVNGMFLILLALPLLTSESPLGLNIVPLSWIGTITQIAIFSIAVQGLNILIGYTGQISLGHAAFMAVGAYSAAIFNREMGVPFFLSIPLAALFTGVVGLLFGLPSIRVKGFYLGMATLAAQFIIPWIISKSPLNVLTNGDNPLDVPPAVLGPLNFTSDSAMFYLVIPLAVLLFFLARNIIRTRVGRAFVSIRDNDLAAELLGINVFSYKLQAFFLSSVYAGIAGALAAYDTGAINYTTYNLDKSVLFLAMLVVGGAGFPLGAVFGATFLTLLQFNIIPPLSQTLKEVLPGLLPFIQEVNIEASLRPFLFGFSLILFLILLPRGIAYQWEIFKIAWRIRPYSN